MVNATMAGIAHVKAILTAHTCGDACWYAREDVCRCSCGGLNHGVLLVPGGERPPRTRRTGKYRWQLAGVVPGWRAACEYAAGLYTEIGERPPASYSIIPSWGKPPLWAVCGATDAQIAKWTELAAYQGYADGASCQAVAERSRPYLIWRQITD